MRQVTVAVYPVEMQLNPLECRTEGEIGDTVLAGSDMGVGRGLGGQTYRCWRGRE